MDHHTAQALKDRHEPAIRAIERRLRKSPDGTLQLDVRDASELGVDPGAFANLIHSLDETNRKIQAGELTADQISTNYDDHPRGT